MKLWTNFTVLIFLILIFVVIVFFQHCDSNEIIVITSSKEEFPVFGEEKGKRVFLLLPDERKPQMKTYLEDTVTDVILQVGNITKFIEKEETKIDKTSGWIEHVKSIQSIEIQDGKKYKTIVVDGKKYSGKNINILSLPVSFESKTVGIVKEVSIEIPLNTVLNLSGCYTFVDETLTYEVYYNDIYSKLDNTTIFIKSATLVTNIDSHLDGVTMLSHILSSFINHMERLSRLTNKKVDILAKSVGYIQSNFKESSVGSVYN